MAGDWIKIRHNLDEDPRVLRIAQLLSIDDLDLLVGKLWRFWRYGDTQTVDGFIPFASAETVDRITRLSGLGNALVAVGWIDVSDKGVQIVRFDDHISESAKRRASNTSRQRKLRGRAPVAQPARQERDEPPTKALPREEKRREEETPPFPPSGGGKKNSPEVVDPSGQPIRREVFPIPAGIDTPAFRTAWDRWKRHSASKGNRFSLESYEAQMRLLEGLGEARAIAALNSSIERNYTAIVEPRDAASPRNGTGSRRPSDEEFERIATGGQP